MRLAPHRLQPHAIPSLQPQVPKPAALGTQPATIGVLPATPCDAHPGAERRAGEAIAAVRTHPVDLDLSLSLSLSPTLTLTLTLTLSLTLTRCARTPSTWTGRASATLPRRARCAPLPSYHPSLCRDARGAQWHARLAGYLYREAATPLERGCGPTGEGNPTRGSSPIYHPYQVLKQQDLYCNPGPLQFHGALGHTLTHRLRMEQRERAAQVSQW